MKRSLLFAPPSGAALTLAGTGLVASTYGLVRLAYGLLLPDVQASLGLGSAAAGYVAASASVAYCVGALGGLVAQGQARRLVVGALATASLGSLGMAVAHGVPLFGASAVLASTGAGLASPALVALVARNVAEPARGRAQATVNAGTGPGLVAAGLLALLLLPHWRLCLVAAAVASAATGLAVLRLDRRPPAAAPAPGPAGPWVRTLAAPAAAALLLGTASAVVWTYGRTQLVYGGADRTASTLAWVALGLGGAATVATAARLARWSPARAWRVTVLATAGAIAVLGLAADRLVVAAAACAVFGWGFVAASSALIAWAGELVPDRAAAGTSLLFVTLVLGQAVGSAAAGAIAERWSLTAAFLVMAAVATVSASPASVRGAVRRPVVRAAASSG